MSIIQHQDIPRIFHNSFYSCKYKSFNFDEFQVKNNLVHASDGKEAMDYLYKKGKYENSSAPSLIYL